MASILVVKAETRWRLRSLTCSIPPLSNFANHAVEPRANAVRRFFLRQNAITDSPETPYFSCVCATFLKVLGAGLSEIDELA
jgi:hypothetical protein